MSKMDISLDLITRQRGPVAILFIKPKALHPAKTSGTWISVSTALRSLLRVCQTRNFLIKDERQ